MNWNINSDDSVDKDEMHRRSKAGSEFAEKLLMSEVEHLAKHPLTGSALKKDIFEHGVYAGIASELVGIMERSEEASKQTMKAFPGQERRVRAMRLLTMAHLVRVLIENADEIKRL